MATDCETRLLKQFLDKIEVNKLFSIVRSVYRSDEFVMCTREDAEMFLLIQPYDRVLSSKRVPITTLLRFLLSKGIKIPRSYISRTSLCLAFKSLIERQPDYMIQPVQPMLVPYNNMLAITQNNNIMYSQPNHGAVQHQLMPMPTPASGALVPNPKSQKDHDNELLKECIEVFVKCFYNLFNNLGMAGRNQLDSRYFYENCTMALKIVGGCQEINKICEESTSILHCLLSIKEEHKLFFSPHLTDVKWKMESHGLLIVNIGGTLHCEIGRLVGLFEQQFLLREDPLADNSWKILNTNFMMKNIDLNCYAMDLS